MFNLSFDSVLRLIGFIVIARFLVLGVRTWRRDFDQRVSEGLRRFEASSISAIRRRRR